MRKKNVRSIESVRERYITETIDSREEEDSRDRDSCGEIQRNRSETFNWSCFHCRFRDKLFANIKGARIVQHERRIQSLLRRRRRRRLYDTHDAKRSFSFARFEISRVHAIEILPRISASLFHGRVTASFPKTDGRHNFNSRSRRISRGNLISSFNKSDDLNMNSIAGQSHDSK